MNFTLILFAHFIADTSFQPTWMLNAKKTNWYVMMEHCIVYTAIVSMVFAYLQGITLIEILFLIIGHYVIDSWKAHTAKDILDLKYLYIDQALHITQLLLVFFI